MSNQTQYKDLIAFHPASYIIDIMEDLNITQKEFAQKLGTSTKSLSVLVNGEERLSNDMALKLSKLTGTSIDLWLNLQKAYDKKMLEIEDLKKNDELEVCNLIDFHYFKKYRFVEDRKYSKSEKVRIMRKISHNSDLTNLMQFNSAVSFRNSKRIFDDKTIINSNIILEIASDKARNACDTKLNKQKLKKYLPEIRLMTVQEPKVFFNRLKNILLECGIVLVALPNLKNAKINGATKRFKNGSVLLLITDRNKYCDIFWFSIIHEISHILDSDFETNYLDEESYHKKEDKADKFASNFFINEDIFNSFVEKNNFTKDSILSLAEGQNVHPSIILGKLQNKGICDYNYLPDLKIQYHINLS